MHIVYSIAGGGGGGGLVGKGKAAMYEDLVILCNCTLFAPIVLILTSTFMQIKLI